MKVLNNKHLRERDTAWTVVSISVAVWTLRTVETLRPHISQRQRAYLSTNRFDRRRQSVILWSRWNPLTITKDKRIISGHRRMAAMVELGWDECEVRVIEQDNEIMSLIEHNPCHRQKTASDILNEARFLEKELEDVVEEAEMLKGRGDKNQGQRLRMVTELVPETWCWCNETETTSFHL